MKKERNLLSCFLIIFVAYFVMLFFNEFLSQNWFSFGLLFLAVFMTVKSYLFRSDSSLFLAVFLMYCFIIFSGLFEEFSFFEVATFLSLASSLSLFLTFTIFGNKFCFWTSLTSFLLTFPIFLYITHCINLLLMILFLCGAIILAILLICLKRYGKI